MKIILDAMGGDNAPGAILAGAAMAAAEYPVDICVVGQEESLRHVAEEEKIDLSRLRIIDAPGVLTMEDKPLCVVRDKKDSSMAVGLGLLANGEGDAFVSAGNTGALLAGATLIVKRIKGISRAGIATILPFQTPVLLLDSGANLELNVDNMEQFAEMGSLYMKKVCGVASPRVGQINNGTEYNKGLPLQVETYARLSASDHILFVGNIEARQIPFGDCDVLLADGFTGNVTLKLIEGMSKMMLGTVKELFYTNALTKLSGKLMQSHVKDLKKRFDASEHGGAPLLGISKPVIKAHGSSDAKAIKSAIWQAIQMQRSGLIRDIADAAETLTQSRNTVQTDAVSVENAQDNAGQKS